MISSTRIEHAMPSSIPVQDAAPATGVAVSGQSLSITVVQALDDDADSVPGALSRKIDATVLGATAPLDANRAAAAFGDLSRARFSFAIVDLFIAEMLEETDKIRHEATVDKQRTLTLQIATKNKEVDTLKSEAGIRLAGGLISAGGQAAAGLADGMFTIRASSTLTEARGGSAAKQVTTGAKQNAASTNQIEQTTASANLSNQSKQIQQATLEDTAITTQAKSGSTTQAKVGGNLDDGASSSSGSNATDTQRSTVGTTTTTSPSQQAVGKQSSSSTDPKADPKTDPTSDPKPDAKTNTKAKPRSDKMTEVDLHLAKGRALSTLSQGAAGAGSAGFTFAADKQNAEKEKLAAARMVYESATGSAETLSGEFQRAYGRTLDSLDGIVRSTNDAQRNAASVRA
ncbi:hypothetical protein [Paraburkholderia agricolaris]|uniref:hypothetical protein n=1 Tax=Paraburkholderia agricolaris TaxID=2152888 RepID=UPI00129175E4|nr:hypothetical protein [Paraburkholderia agricolaris]